ncbi:thioredoxin fold domain-containing protein [Haliea sp. E17]|uniref:thioredoxin fold domain-containing protein n=1 Tax=Haliea sp. E17 TaxID=3401576 RepID=UPI003AAF3B0D
MPRHSIAILLLPLILLTACAREQSPASTPSTAAPSPAIPVPDEQLQAVAWFDGSIEQAFAAAKTRNRPLFIYWGAEWCPYCKQLQATIFVREEFIRMSRQFIALDMSNGDSETIRQSDRFKIIGLPTVIVFAPDGTELTRIPGGMDLEQYAAVLELTLNTLRPVSALLAAAQAGATLEDDDWRLLGHYSWDLDRGSVLGEQKPSLVLAQLAADCPPRLALACSRLDLSAIYAWLEAEEEDRDAATGTARLRDFTAILADPGLRRANIVSLAELGPDVLTELATGEEQAELQATLLEQLAAAVDDESLNILRRASVLSGWSRVATALQAEDDTQPGEQVAWAKAAADQMMAALSPYEVHAGVYSLWGVYYRAGLEPEARATLARGIAESKAPYYFMNGMAYIDLKANNTAAALAWYRKAWEATSEPAHRASWGRGYILKLLELAPDEDAEIERASAQWLEELLAQPYALEIYSRSLGRVSEKMLAWSEGEPGRGEVIAALRADMERHCAAATTDADTLARCREFLSPAEIASAD